MKYLIVNTTRATVLGDQVLLAATSAQRRTGLLKHSSLPKGSGLWIKPCESIHTFFMRFAIDVIYLDRKGRVRKIRHALPPSRLSLCLVAKSVLELPAGTVLASQTQLGDQLEFQPSDTDPTH